MRSIIILSTLLFAAHAHADDGGAFRFGLGAGKATIEADDLDLEGKATAWEVFGGYELNRFIAFEAGYIDGGSADDSIFGATVRADTTAIAASILGSLPIGESFSVYGRLGYMHWESEQRLVDAGVTIASADVDGDDPFFGAGMAALVDSALVRLEYRVADLDDTDLSLISLAIAWRFY
jgi:OOP family OmpA-OmpF porin